MKRVAGIIILLLTGILLAGCGKGEYKDGIESLNNGKYEEAVTHLNKAVEEEYNIGDALRGIGIAKWELQDYKGAVEAFRQALDNGAKETSALYNLMGACMLKLEDPESAVSYYEKGIAVGYGAGEVIKEMRFNIIAAYEKLEDWENAKAKLAEYTEEYPDDEQAAKEAEFLETR